MEEEKWINCWDERPPKDGQIVFIRVIKPIKWTAYKPGAPASLLKKGGRWQQLNEYGGWENMSVDEPEGEWSR